MKEIKYELVVIYPTSENEISVEKSIVEKCKKYGFEVMEVDKWGVKTLAYEIKKEQKGYYLRLVIGGGNAAELDKALSMDDKIMRYLLIKVNS